jgi:Rod binding domain-containing protein
MKYFSRYPHVKDLIIHYANFFSEDKIFQQQELGVLTPQDAEKFSLFIWKMVEQMRKDSEENIIVLGSTDNSEMLQDVYYEISSFMSECGFESIWEKVSEEA